jgi:uncharacterized membrane protein YozB (DUF420 family)
MPPQVESSVESPETLLRLLDLQIAARRAKRKEISPHRSAMLAAGVLFILAGGMIAFYLLFVSLTNVPRPGGHAPTAAATHQQ